MRLWNRLKHPVDGVMHVEWCSPVDRSDVRGPCTIVYTIEAPGTESVSAQRIFDVSTAQWPHPGQDLPVTFDRARPSRITIQWHLVLDVPAPRVVDAAADVFGTDFATGTGLSDVLLDGVPIRFVQT
jgi:hypothetical protein